MIRIAHVNENLPRSAGFRVLVTRKWPRGIAKDQIDQWQKELGCSPELQKDFKKSRITLAGFQARYYGEVSEPGRRELLNELQRRAMKNGEDLILLCDGDVEESSVRKFLKEILETS